MGLNEGGGGERERGKLYFFTIIADILFGYCVLAGWIEITRLKANREREMWERVVLLGEGKMLLVMVDKKWFEFLCVWIWVYEWNVYMWKDNGCRGWHVYIGKCTLQ